MSICTVEDCEDAARGLGLCLKHYTRLRRHGHTDSTRPFSRTTGDCPVDGCEQPQSFNGMCKLHATRVARHGDPLAVTHQRDRALPRGTDHHAWTGDAASYSVVHQRLRRIKGRAAGHACADCGGLAAQWSYDHADPRERNSELGAYSTDPSHYLPRCVPCHKRSDLALKPLQTAARVDLEVVKTLHASGVRARAMSRQLGVNVRRINAALDELGLPRFPPGRPYSNLHESPAVAS